MNYYRVLLRYSLSTFISVTKRLFTMYTNHGLNTYALEGYWWYFVFMFATVDNFDCYLDRRFCTNFWLCSMELTNTGQLFMLYKGNLRFGNQYQRRFTRQDSHAAWLLLCGHSQGKRHSSTPGRHSWPISQQVNTSRYWPESQRYSLPKGKQFLWQLGWCQHW